MSINFCTLTNSSVDTFCGNRRSIVLGNLINQKYAQIGTNNSSVRDSFAKQRPDLVHHVEDDDRQPLVFEQPFITVEVWMDGIRQAQTLEAVQHLDFVTVTDLSVSTRDASESVNILDLTIRQL